MIHIRVDGNHTIGTGHVMRCLSLAEAAGILGEKVVFIVADHDSEELLRSRGGTTVCLDSKWDMLETEIERMEQFLQKNEVHTLLIDSYFVSSNYLKMCRKYTKVVYIDDLHQEIWPCDILVNYSNYCDKYDYGREYPDTKLLLGCKYAPLRQIFANVKKTIEYSVSRILVLTGGTDPYHFARDFADSIVRNENKIEFDIVCGIYNQDIGELRAYAEKRKNIRIWNNVQRMDDLMKTADIAITAGGTTLYELAACGTPTICYSFVDNQLENVKNFADKGYMLYCGDLRKGMGCKDVWEQIAILRDDFEKRRDMSRKLQELVDGRGAERVIRELL